MQWWRIESSMYTENSWLILVKMVKGIMQTTMWSFHVFRVKTWMVFRENIFFNTGHEVPIIKTLQENYPNCLDYPILKFCSRSFPLIVAPFWNLLAMHCTFLEKVGKSRGGGNYNAKCCSLLLFRWQKTYAANLDVNAKRFEHRQPGDQTQPAWVYERQGLLDRPDLSLWQSDPLSEWEEDCGCILFGLQ